MASSPKPNRHSTERGKAATPEPSGECPFKHHGSSHGVGIADSRPQTLDHFGGCRCGRVASVNEGSEPVRPCPCALDLARMTGGARLACCARSQFAEVRQ